LCTFLFYSAWSVFLQSHLYLFCNHTAIKLQSLTCVVSATVFFLQSQHINGQGCFAITLYFHQVATTWSKYQTSHTKLIRGAITLRHDLQSNTFWFATVVFFCNRSTSVVANTLQRIFAITSIFGPGCNLASILQCRGTELFYQFFAIAITLL
jgi:hypothetical protein